MKFARDGGRRADRLAPVCGFVERVVRRSHAPIGARPGLKARAAQNDGPPRVASDALPIDLSTVPRRTPQKALPMVWKRSGTSLTTKR